MGHPKIAYRLWDIQFPDRMRVTLLVTPKQTPLHPNGAPEERVIFDFVEETEDPVNGPTTHLLQFSWPKKDFFRVAKAMFVGAEVRGNDLIFASRGATENSDYKPNTKTLATTEVIIGQWSDDIVMICGRTRRTNGSEYRIVMGVSYKRFMDTVNMMEIEHP